jgi:hypothetical protein
MHDAPTKIPTVITFLNELDGITEKLSTLAELSPLLDEASDADKGRLGVRLLNIVGDYVAELAALSSAFSQTLPWRPEEVEP